MYVEEIKEKNGIIRVSSIDKTNEQQMDFDLDLLTDRDVLQKLDFFLAQRNIKHYIVVKNALYENKKVSFSSDNVQNDLYFIQENGKVIRWENVAVSFIRIGESNVATCISTAMNARGFNRRASFRVPIDQYGYVKWRCYDDGERCMVKDISHIGLGIILDEPKFLPPFGELGEVSWTEEIYSEDRKTKVSNLYKVNVNCVRLQAKLGSKLVIGCTIEDEPDNIRDMIQRYQTSRGIVKEADTATSSQNGIVRSENWELKRDLDNMH